MEITMWVELVTLWDKGNTSVRTYQPFCLKDWLETENTVQIKQGVGEVTHFFKWEKMRLWLLCAQRATVISISDKETEAQGAQVSCPVSQLVKGVNQDWAGQSCSRAGVRNHDAEHLLTLGPHDRPRGCNSWDSWYGSYLIKKKHTCINGLLFMLM